jgi:SNF2 family DNA or RNA helicase
MLHNSLPPVWESKQCEDCEKTVGATSRRKSISAHVPAKKRAGYDSDSDGIGMDLPPSSAKIRKMLEILNAIRLRTKGERDEDGKNIPSEKTIVFSQFTTMLDLIEPFLAYEGIDYARCEYN